MTDFDMPDAPKVTLVPKYQPRLTKRALQDDLEKARVTEVQTKVKGAKPLKVLTLVDVEPEDTHWLWYPYVPANRLALLEGDPGAGKSWITCSLAASLSSGTSLPFQPEALPPKDVLMASAEDGLRDTMYPRIKQLGGDMRRIHFIDDKFMLDEKGMAQLAEAVQRFNAKVLIIDPIVSYIGKKVDMYRANEVRDIMRPLAELAERLQIAVIVVRHLRKEGGKSEGKALYKGIGSIDFTAAARTVLQVSEDRNGTKVMHHVKSNGAPKGPSLEYAFEIRKEPMKMVDPLSGVLVVQTNWTSASFLWIGEYKKIAERKVSTERRPQEKAIDFLKDALKEGPQLVADLLVRAEKKGITKRTLQRAKGRLGISFRDGPEGPWYWRLATPQELKDLRVDESILDDVPYVIPEGQAAITPPTSIGRGKINRDELAPHLKELLDKYEGEGSAS